MGCDRLVVVTNRPVALNQVTVEVGDYRLAGLKSEKEACGPDEWLYVPTFLGVCWQERKQPCRKEAFPAYPPPEKTASAYWRAQV
jgi:hypothetical protein